MLSSCRSGSYALDRAVERGAFMVAQGEKAVQETGEVVEAMRGAREAAEIAVAEAVEALDVARRHEVDAIAQHRAMIAMRDCVAMNQSRLAEIVESVEGALAKARGEVAP